MKKRVTMEKKVWFITGASRGLALALTKKLLARNYYVVATAASKAALTTAVQQATDNFLPLEADPASYKSIAAAIAAGHDYFGRIDVLVNNAGCCASGALETVSEQAVQQSFGENVFAVINSTKALLPLLRVQGSGHIINISSGSGIAAGTGQALFAASRSAVTGFSEALAEEVKPMGVRLTVAETGDHYTRFPKPESLLLRTGAMDAYSAAGTYYNSQWQAANKEAAGQDKIISDLIGLAENPDPPVKLLMGSCAQKRAAAEIAGLLKEFMGSAD